MFEFVFAILCAAFSAGLLTAFRKQRLLERRLDRLERDHNLLASRELLLTLNRVPAQAIELLSPEQSDGRPAAETARTEIHPPTPSAPPNWRLRSGRRPTDRTPSEECT
jgi:hypothetical protein